ncbi:hypothetical protein V7S43_012472 [Phytophthora oleae]|uniref:DNA polymerase beta-like N-terminal domain-containing protein n=1 Tax=Phytophthora oleae TaxID=2107226 RepID=A0ABD3FAU6_9STRA
MKFQVAPQMPPVVDERSRFEQPAPTLEQKPTLSPPIVDPIDVQLDKCNDDGITNEKKLTMEEKLRRWRLIKQSRQKSNVGGATKRSSRGNGLPPSLKKSRLSKKAPEHAEFCSSAITPASANCVVASTSNPEVHVHVLAHRSVQSSIVTPALDKEPRIELSGQNIPAPVNFEQLPVPTPSPKLNLPSCNSATTVQQLELLAKNLIRVGIKFEKRSRITTAFSIFKRAYHVLPRKTAKLVERLLLQEREHPEVVDQVPSQDMLTAAYMVKVLERDLMDVLNHGTEKDLTELHAIGGKRARLLVDIRPFRQLEELQKIPGISANIVTNLYQHHTNWENHL